MVVEDNTSIVKLIELFLNELTVEIYTAPTGERALEEFENFRPDLVLLDMHLPGKSGLQTAQEMRKLMLRIRAPSPIVAMTADESEELKQKFTLAGVGGFLMKPFKKEELIRQVTADSP